MNETLPGFAGPLNETLDLTVRESIEDRAPPGENLFRPLADDARRTLRKIMLTTDNPKLAASVAESILDRAGEGKRQEAMAPSIVISESQVNLLVQAQKEAFGEPGTARG